MIVIHISDAFQGQIIETLEHWILRETDERINYTKKIEERFFEMEKEIEAEKLKLTSPIKILSNDPEVAVNAKSMIKNKHDRNDLSSVVNSRQEPKPETVIHQLPITTTEVKSEVNIHSNNMKEVLNNIEPTRKFKAGTYIVENFFKLLTMITIETFKVLETGLDKNLV